VLGGGGKWVAGRLSQGFGGGEGVEGEWVAK